MKNILFCLAFVTSMVHAETARVIINKDAVDSETTSDGGFAVTRLNQNSNLFKAGVRNGDKLIRIGENKVDSVASYAEGANLLLVSKGTVEVEIVRDGEHKILPVLGRGITPRVTK